MKNKISGIYSITNKINGKIYYGSSNNLNNRKRQHFGSLKRNKHGNPHLQASWNKYGYDSFEFKIEKEVPIDQLLDIEQEYLDIIKKTPELYYNIGYNSDAPKRGIPCNEYTKQRLKEVNTGNKYCLGKKHSKETRKNMSLSHIGKPSSVKGKHWNEESKRKISLQRKKDYIGKGNPFYGKHHSKKSIEKNRLSHIGIISKSSILNKTIYTFKNDITKETFQGIKRDFIKKYGLISQNVCALIGGRRKLVNNWRILNANTN